MCGGQFYGEITRPVSGYKMTTEIIVIDGDCITLLSKKIWYNSNWPPCSVNE